MTALDSCEPQMIRALEKEGWEVFLKPHTIDTPLRAVFADFSLRRWKDGTLETIIVVEVKCFADERQDLNELYRAIGQYQFYRTALRNEGKGYALYLAVPEDALRRLILDPTVVESLTDSAVQLVVIDIAAEEVVSWQL